MKKTVAFALKLVDASLEDELFVLAGNMTFKLILSLFPLLIFAFSVVGFLNLDSGLILETISGALPDDIMLLVTTFISEVVDVRSKTVLSASLIATIYSSSSGFMSIIKGINVTYNQTETRNWFYRRLLSIVLVLLFVLMIIISMGMLIFSRGLQDLVLRYIDETPLMQLIFSLVGYFIAVGIILAVAVFIYKVSICKKVKIVDVLPGACVTVIFWIAFSKIFNIYLSNYAKYSILYGSIGSIFILLIWLNFITTILLVGSEINSMLEQPRR